METNYTQIWITAIGALVVIVTTVFTYIQGRQTRAEAKAIREEQRAIVSKVEANTALTVEAKAEVVKLKENVDGKMDAYVAEVRRAERSIGTREGGEAERDRPPEIVSEPQQVHDAMNGKDVREQIDAIAAGTARIESHASAVAEDLAAAHKRADEVADGGESGAAADASAKQTAKEKREDKS